MAEFCFDYWKKLNDIDIADKEVLISKDLDLCEGCGKMKEVVVCYKKREF